MPAVDWFEIFRPAKLDVFTRLDQTEAYGSIRAWRPGSGFPKTLKPASRERIVGLSLERHAAGALTAA